MNKAGLYEISKWLLGLFYLLAGLNHFWNPGFYIPLIPDYLPAKESLNIIVGLIEVVLGLGMWIKTWQHMAAWSIIVLLILLIPSHVYFIQMGSCAEGSLCIPPWFAWLRLIVVHPLLMLWAYYHAR